MGEGAGLTRPRGGGLRIAFIGQAANTSLQRAQAMERLGHQVAVIDPRRFLPASRSMSRWLHHTGGVGVRWWIDAPIAAAVERHRPQLVWVDQGAFLDRGLIARLRGLGAPLVNYAVDDPFGKRDGRRFAAYLRAVPFYDLMVVVRDENLPEAYARGARRVLKTWRCADEVAHRPRCLTAQDRAEWASRVCFAGHCFPERGPFIAALVKAGVPVSVWGDGWQRAAQWPVIAPHWRGGAQLEPDAYAKIIQAADICLGLVSAGNRDQSTSRSMEIPAMGGMLCAARTAEHRQLYEEGVEAVFWSTPEECAAACHDLLARPARMRAIRQAGAARAKVNGNFNETMIENVIAACLPAAARR